MAVKRRQQHIVEIVVILIVGLGVFNAMTMATFERTREFGVLVSLGTRPERILGLVVAESLLLGLIGCLVGVAIAMGVLHGLGAVSLAAFAQQDLLGVRFPAVIHLHVHGQALASAAATALLTVLAGGLWPAFRASRLKPVEATRFV